MPSKYKNKIKYQKKTKLNGDSNLSEKEFKE